MVERCPKCGSEMVMVDLKPVYASLDAGPEPDTVSMAYRYNLRCPLDPKDCRIAELERQLEEAMADAEGWFRQEQDRSRMVLEVASERDEARSQLEEAKANESALRMDLAQTKFELSRAPKGFRCYHCDEVFESLDAAKHHFGPHSTDIPKCVESNTLLARMRKQVVELESKFDEARSQLEEAKARAEDMKQRNAKLRQERVDYYSGSALEAAHTQLRESQLAVVALREALDKAGEACWYNEHGEVQDIVREALSNTSTLAAQRKREIAREAAEAVVRAVCTKGHDFEVFIPENESPYFRESSLREGLAAILNPTEPA